MKAVTTVACKLDFAFIVKNRKDTSKEMIQVLVFPSNTNRFFFLLKWQGLKWCRCLLFFSCKTIWKLEKKLIIATLRKKKCFLKMRLVFECKIQKWNPVLLDFRWLYIEKKYFTWLPKVAQPRIIHWSLALSTQPILYSASWKISLCTCQQSN